MKFWLSTGQTYRAWWSDSCLWLWLLTALQLPSLPPRCRESPLFIPILLQTSASSRKVPSFPGACSEGNVWTSCSWVLLCTSTSVWMINTRPSHSIPRDHIPWILVFRAWCLMHNRQYMYAVWNAFWFWKCVCVCVYVPKCVSMCALARVYAQVCAHVCACMCICTCVWVCVIFRARFMKLLIMVITSEILSILVRYTYFF